MHSQRLSHGCHHTGPYITPNNCPRQLMTEGLI